MTAPTVLVTGANRGIGRALVSSLLECGDAVVMTARDPERGRRAEADLRRAHPGAKLELHHCDLSSPESVRALAGLVAEGRPLDGVVHNAGLLQAPPDRGLTADGVEVCLATNALGPLLLTRELMTTLAPGARVVSLTSRLHRPGSRGEPVDFDFEDPNLDRGYHPDRAYKNSKLALLWATSVLDRELSAESAGSVRATSNAVCPGFVPVTAARHTRGWLRFRMRWIVPRLPFAVSTEQAASDVLWTLNAPELTGRGGLYLADRQVVEPSPDAADPQLAGRFAALADELWPGSAAGPRRSGGEQ